MLVAEQSVFLVKRLAGSHGDCGLFRQICKQTRVVPHLDAMAEATGSSTPSTSTVRTSRWGSEEPRTLTEIGKQYSLSRERIRQLQQQALRRLRGHLEQSL